MNIYESLTKIMAEVTAIGKNQKNSQQNFHYRGIDDVMNELHGLFAKYKVIIIPKITNLLKDERSTKNGGTIFYVTVNCDHTFVAEDGTSLQTTVIGEAMDSGDKAITKAMSVALKYALLQMLLIPTNEDKDPDKFSHEIVPSETQKAKDFIKKATPKLISEAQRNRLYAITNEVGLKFEEAKSVINSFGFESSKDITSDKYNEIEAAIREMGAREVNDDFEEIFN